MVKLRCQWKKLQDIEFRKVIKTLPKCEKCNSKRCYERFNNCFKWYGKDLNNYEDFQFVLENHFQHKGYQRFEEYQYVNTFREQQKSKQIQKEQQLEAEFDEYKKQKKLLPNKIIKGKNKMKNKDIQKGRNDLIFAKNQIKIDQKNTSQQVLVQCFDVLLKF